MATTRNRAADLQLLGVVAVAVAVSAHKLVFESDEQTHDKFAPPVLAAPVQVDPDEHDSI